MATTTITQFKRLARDADGGPLPIADDYVAGQTMTAAGTSSAMSAGTKFVRIATDTAYLVNAYGAGTAVLVPAGAVEYFPAEEGQTFALTALA